MTVIGPPTPYDPELAAALEQIVPLLASLMSGEVPAGDQPALMVPLTDEDLTRNGRFSVEERSVPGPPDSPEISLLIIRPVDAPGPTPVFYHTHGGGMITGDNRLGLDSVLTWAEEFGAAVVSVEYRLAPATPHPGPIEDVYAGLEWVAANAVSLGIDPSRVVIAGASAGGGLTAALALLARDRGGPAVVGQVLMCPMLDDRNDTVSAVQMTGLGVWDSQANAAGWGALLGEARGTADVSPYAAPARATDLRNLPPALVDVGSAETFRDEAVAYASAIWQAGGQCELHVWPGGFHGYDGFVPHAALSEDTREARLRWLRRLLGA
ncbi:alpha/beta hydrolase [Cryptosporangium phraense]|uniref:Alpha/beta hydrolase n=1 Tax=Cryptosporangium phraense TaxID=2593070 RepID=A0A545AGC4_9ACTN|nr:alpha/beta hydrolase [Cryptosporangium phraense]TQS40372.1 alpha/beta hydrolase [Cryptosporangium phraense]